MEDIFRKVTMKRHNKDKAIKKKLASEKEDNERSKMEKEMKLEDK